MAFITINTGTILANTDPFATFQSHNQRAVVAGNRILVALDHATAWHTPSTTPPAAVYSEWGVHASDDGGLTWVLVHARRVMGADLRPPSIQVFDATNPSSLIYIVSCTNTDNVANMEIEVYHADTVTSTSTPVATVTIPHLCTAKLSTALVRSPDTYPFLAVLTRDGSLNNTNFSAVALDGVTGMPILSPTPSGTDSGPYLVKLLKVMSNSPPNASNIPGQQFLQDPCLLVDAFGSSLLMTMTGDSYSFPTPTAPTETNYSCIVSMRYDFKSSTFLSLQNEVLNTPVMIAPQQSAPQQPPVPRPPGTQYPTLLVRAIGPQFNSYLTNQGVCPLYYHFLCVNKPDPGGDLVGRYVRVSRATGAKQDCDSLLTVDGTELGVMYLFWNAGTRLYVLASDSSNQYVLYLIYSEDSGDSWTIYTTFQFPAQDWEIYAPGSYQDVGISRVAGTVQRYLFFVVTLYRPPPIPSLTSSDVRSFRVTIP